MPRNRNRRGSKGPQEAEQRQWESHARITARATERADAKAAPSQYGSKKYGFEKLATGAAAAPGEQESRRTAEEAAQCAYRTWQEDQMAAGYEPHRHSVTVCGRPVQVTTEEISLECAFVAFPFQCILVTVFAVGLIAASVSSSP